MTPHKYPTYQRYAFLSSFFLCFPDQIGYKKPAEISKPMTRTDPDYGKPNELTNQVFHSYANSDFMPDPWLRVDLEDAYFLQEVVIMAAVHLPLQNFAIRIGNVILL